MITTKLYLASLPQLTTYTSIHHAIGELLKEGWHHVTFQCSNVAVMADEDGNRIILEDMK